MGPVLNQQILSAKTTSGVTAYLPASLDGQYIESTVYVVFSAGAAAGAAVLETAPSADYAGTWANIGTVSWAAVSRAHYISVTGIFKSVRLRISSSVTSGTIDAYVIATH